MISMKCTRHKLIKEEEFSGWCISQSYLSFPQERLNANALTISQFWDGHGSISIHIDQPKKRNEKLHDSIGTKLTNQ